MKVLHLTFNMGIGGTEQVIRQIITGLDRKGVENEVFCIDGICGPIGRQLQEKGVTIHTFQRQPGIDFRLAGAIRRILADGGFDIIHCHQYTPFFYGWLAALGTRVKVVFTEHGRFHPDRYRYKAILFNPVLARLTSKIVAISKATAAALERYEFFPRSRISVIYNGIERLAPDPAAMGMLKTSLGISPNAFVVGTVSRLDMVKNQTMMVRAFSRFREVCPEAVLLMVGDGPERAGLQNLVDELNITDHVIFTGFIEHPENHLAIMDVFLLSSFTEGTSMTLLEAMSLGIPTVATRVGGNPEIVHDQVTGLLTPSDDASAFAEAMRRLYQNSDLRIRMGASSQERYEAVFTVNRMVDSYLNSYCEVTEGSAGRV